MKLTLESLVQKATVDDVLALALSLQEMVEQIVTSVRVAAGSRGGGVPGIVRSHPGPGRGTVRRGGRRPRAVPVRH